MKNKKRKRESCNFGSVPMERSLDSRGCFIVRDFFRKLLKAADLADKNNGTVTETAISKLMIMYRNRVI